MHWPLWILVGLHTLTFGTRSSFEGECRVVARLDEWDVARDLQLKAHPGSAKLTEDVSLGNMAQKRSPGMAQILEFKSHKRAFLFEIDLNNYLIGRNASFEGAPLAVIGKRLQVRSGDGQEEIIEKPFARFTILRSDQGEIQVQGGFQYQGHFYKLGPRDGVLWRSQGGVEEPDSKKPSLSTIVSRRNVERMHEGPQGETYRCGAEDLSFNKRQSGTNAKIIKSLAGGKDAAKILRVPKKERDEIIRDANLGCPVKTQQLTVAVVADCNYVKTLGGRKKARQNILNEMNLVSGVFTKTYNIDLSVNSVELLDKCDKGDSFNVHCKDYPGLDLALNRFSKWRDERSADAGIYHLITSCNYSETVGLAWVNQVCRTSSFTDSQADIISGTSMSVLVDNHFSVIAHELAHNLGAIHDCDRSTCGGHCKDLLECQCCPCDECDCKGRYIMDAKSGGFGALEFSSCTIKDVCDKLPYLGTCIKEQAEKIPDLIASCGNGIREGEEECDCGTAEQCAKSKCCTANCKLKPNVQCADENDPCCRDCLFVPASAKEVCRMASSSCQEDTICNGKSGACPKTLFKADGTACSVDGKCASGVCTSRNIQCSIFGRHLNVTQSCLYTKRSCSVICQGPDQCLDLNANYIDGTPCGERGHCYMGMCSEFGSEATKVMQVPWTLVALKAAISVMALLVGLL